MESTNTDILIIGGGVNGTSIAMALAERNPGKITLVEKGGLATGATGRSGAMVREHYLNVELVRMASDAKKFFEEWPQETGYDLKYQTTGRILLFDESDAGAAIANGEMNRTEGVNIETLNPEETKKLIPSANLNDIGVSLYEPEAGYADPVATTYAFAEEAQKKGAQIITRTPVKNLLIESGKVTGVETVNGKIKAEIVINVTGPWANILIGHNDMPLPITPIRVQMVHLRRPPNLEMLEHIIIDHTCGAYYRTDGKPNTLVGGESPEDMSEVVNPDTFGLNADHDFITRFWNRAINRFPDFADATCRGGYGSLYDMTPDANPILGESPNISGLYNVAGFSGHGFKLSPITGEMVADLVTGESKSSHDYNFFRSSRFEENSPITPARPYSGRAHQ
ncbi:MAG: FAD-dependent oxidoreductase [Chloroflexota bacterium]|nr:FAD-dependent oxidoreductase [Chloroflexota bacterium]